MAQFLGITYDGKTYEVDLEVIHPKEWRSIKVHTGLKMGGFLRSFADPDDFDADAIIALLWLAKKRAGEGDEWPDEDSINVLDIVSNLAMVGEPDAEQVDAPKADS